MYQLERMGLLPRGTWKDSDKEFDDLAKRYGMNWFRRRYYRRGLSLANGAAADPKQKKEIFIVEERE